MRKLKITLYSVNVQIRSAIRTAFEGYQYEVTEVTDSKGVTAPKENEIRQSTIDRLNLPDVVDYVVSKSSLTSRTEGLAATLGLRQARNDVFAVILPEAMDFLRDQLDKRGELVLVGSDQAK